MGEKVSKAVEGMGSMFRELCRWEVGVRTVQHACTPNESKHQLE